MRASLDPSPQGTRGRTRWIAGLVLILGTVLSACGVPHGGNAAPSFPGLSTTPVTFRGDGGVTLHGTVVAPPPGRERRAAVVLLHGAGPVTRAEYRNEAEAFARRGIVALVFDKRTAGYSSFHRSYQVLAGDAVAATRALRSQPGVDPDRVGIWGLSEGAWVAVLAANRAPEIAFVITAGAVGMSPARQQAWSYGEFLHHAGVSGSLDHMMQKTGVRQVVGAGLFPEADYDPVPSWEHLRQPVLALWGTLDHEAAPRESSQVIQDALRRGGNTRAAIRFVPDARHNLHVSANGGFDRPYELAPGSADLQATWIKTGVATGSTRPPSQSHPTSAVTRLAPYESPWGQVAAFALFALAFLGHPLVAAARRIRRTPLATPVRRQARLLATFGATSVLGGVVYFFFLVFTAANLIGPVIGGQTIPWLILHLLAVATLVTTVTTAASAWRHRHRLTTGDRVHCGLLLAAGTVFLPWALYWGLLGS
ncbi:alpha/beta hydrolase family protein [Actinomadura harenae]|nr:prolyl oligopeptidase family serine peptidase [Actinomadura harenae]